MSDLQLLTDFFGPLQRLAPGSDQITAKALARTTLTDRSGLRVADIGCGTGASTLVLAEHLDGTVTAVDLLPELLSTLQARAEARGLAHRIVTLLASMDALPLPPGTLDLLWCEGAIYSMGFAAGVAAWRPLLVDGGWLVVSEVVWKTAARPTELEAFWSAEYAEMGTVEDKQQVLVDAGYTVCDTVELPPSCWLDEYYGPVLDRFAPFMAEQGHSTEAQALVDGLRHERRMYADHSEHVAYVFFIARRTDRTSV